MLICKNICQYFTNLNTFLYNNRPFLRSTRGILFPTCNSFVHLKLFCTSVELERFPLHTIKDLNLTHLNYDKENWYKIVAEISQARVYGNNLPETLNLNHIEELLQLESRSQRLKFLTFLFKTERKRLAKTEKKIKKRMERESIVAKNVHNSHIQYGLGKNTLLLGFRKRSVNNYYNKRLANSVLFGQKIVLDLGYDDFMWKKERRDCVAQLRLVLSINKQNSDPYDLYFCNAKTDSHCVKFLQQEMPNIDEALLSLTEQSYLEIFPKKDLVYLSPHAPEILTSYDHNAVYIIGGFVDSVKKEKLSILKAENEGIKSYSLPLEQYILWGAGSKSLTINQVFSIMLTMKETDDWLEAFKHVPTRKLKRLETD